MDSDAGLGGKIGNSKEACIKKQEGRQTNCHAVRGNSKEACIKKQEGRQTMREPPAGKDPRFPNSNNGQGNGHSPAEGGHLQPNNNHHQSNGHSSAEDDIGVSAEDYVGVSAGKRPVWLHVDVACQASSLTHSSADDYIGVSAGKRLNADVACHINEDSSLAHSSVENYLGVSAPVWEGSSLTHSSAEDDRGASAEKQPVWLNADVACHEGSCHTLSKEPPSSLLAEKHLCMPNRNSSRQSNGNPACNNSTLRTYNWRGLQFQLPSALRLAPSCTLHDELLEFRGSLQVLERGVALLEENELGLQYDLVDGALWVTTSSSIFTDMLPAPVEYQLALWRQRCHITQQYAVSASSGMIYSSKDPKMMIADCYIFRRDVFMRAKESAREQHRHVPRDIEAEVAFEFVSATDDVAETWSKCKRFIVVGRAKLAIGICDREDRKEVLMAFRDRHGNVHTEIRQDPRYIDLGRVLPGFRIYFSHMMPIVISHFTAHHQLDLNSMHEEDLQFELCEALSRGFNELAMEIVNGLHTVNFKDGGGRNPLVVAVSSGNMEMIHYLLANRADPNYPDGDNMSPLLYAKANNLQFYDLLKARGDLDVSIQDLCHAVVKEETSNAHIFKANLPGLAKGDVKVQVEDGRVLLISGERKEEEETVSSDRWHRMECMQGSFLRRFRLPDNAEVNAAMENGVLTVTVPKAAPPEPKTSIRSIDISS